MEWKYRGINEPDSRSMPKWGRMSTAPPPFVAMPPAPAPVKTSLFATIIHDLEIATQIIAMVPSPIQPFAGIALELEQVVNAAIAGLAASKGKTVAEIVAQLHEITPIP